jgi:hypothetical protein
MFDSALICCGFVLIFVGLASLLWPLRFLWISTRLAAAMVIAVGSALELIAGDMVDSFPVYLGLTLFLVGLFSLVWRCGFSPLGRAE